MDQRRPLCQRQARHLDVLGEEVIDEKIRRGIRQHHHVLCRHGDNADILVAVPQPSVVNMAFEQIKAGGPGGTGTLAVRINKDKFIQTFRSRFVPLIGIFPVAQEKRFPRHGFVRHQTADEHPVIQRGVDVEIAVFLIAALGGEMSQTAEAENILDKAAHVGERNLLVQFAAGVDALDEGAVIVLKAKDSLRLHAKPVRAEGNIRLVGCGNEGERNASAVIVDILDAGEIVLRIAVRVPAAVFTFHDKQGDAGIEYFQLDAVDGKVVGASVFGDVIMPFVADFVWHEGKIGDDVLTEAVDGLTHKGVEILVLLVEQRHIGVVHQCGGTADVVFVGHIGAYPVGIVAEAAGKFLHRAPVLIRALPDKGKDKGVVAVDSHM